VSVTSGGSEMKLKKRLVDTSNRIIILSALLLVVIIVLSPKSQDSVEIVIEETTSNIIFRYGSSSGKHPNELDTFKGIFIKDMVNKDPVMTKLDLTQEEMDTIHRMMVEIDFFSYPEWFHPKIEGDIISTQTPFTGYYLEYHNESGTKVVYWTTQYTALEDTQYQNLKELALLIIEILQAKPEYKKLPEPTAGYA
jgi:hypothetical protein